MTYIIKHGLQKPTVKNLAEYQLGWSINDQALYINDPANTEEPIQRVISDKALTNLITAVSGSIEKASKEYYNQHMTDTTRILRDTYERNVIYTITFNTNKDDTKDTDDTVNFNFYTATDKEAAISSFIKVWKDSGYLDTTIDLEGTKVIATDNLTKNVYFFIIIKNDKEELEGKFLTTLESSLPSMSMVFNKESSSLQFSINDEEINSLNLKNLIIDGGSWGDTTTLVDSNSTTTITYKYEYSWLKGLFPSDFNESVYMIDEETGKAKYTGTLFDEGTLGASNGIPYDEFYVNTDGDIISFSSITDSEVKDIQDLVLATKVDITDNSETTEESTSEAESSDSSEESNSN